MKCLVQFYFVTQLLYKLLLLTHQVSFGMNFSKIWTAKSLGIDLPNEYESTAVSYVISKSMQGLQMSSISSSPTLAKVRVIF